MQEPLAVCRVHCPQGNHQLLGSSTDVMSALNRHRAQLEMGSHPDKELQSKWDTLSDLFEVEVLDTLKPRDDPGYDPTEDLKELESMWRDRLSPE